MKFARYPLMVVGAGVGLFGLGILATVKVIADSIDRHVNAR